MNHTRLLVRKNLANKLQSVHMPNTFVNIGKENFGEYVAHDSPNSPFPPAKYFPCTVLLLLLLPLAELLVVKNDCTSRFLIVRCLSVALAVLSLPF